VNRNTLQSLFDNIEKWSWAIVLGIGLVALMVVYLVLLFHLLYVLFLAVLVLLVGKMFAQSYSYSQAYRVALYGSVPVMIVGSVLALVPYTLPPFLPTLISLAVIGFNLSQIPSEPKTKS
jgi:hypothetical protein